MHVRGLSDVHRVLARFLQGQQSHDNTVLTAITVRIRPHNPLHLVHTTHVGSECRHSYATLATAPIQRALLLHGCRNEGCRGRDCSLARLLPVNPARHSQDANQRRHLDGRDVQRGSPPERLPRFPRAQATPGLDPRPAIRRTRTPQAEPIHKQYSSQRATSQVGAAADGTQPPPARRSGHYQGHGGWHIIRSQRPVNHYRAVLPAGVQLPDQVSEHSMR